MARSVPVDNGAPAPQAVGAPSRLPTAFRALRHYNYRLFLLGQLISLIGTWMQMIAQQWLVWRLTGSATMLGAISLIGVIPLIPMTLWSGSLSDRLPKRSIIVVAQVVMMIQAFILAALTWTGAVQVWHVMVLAVVLAAANAADMPARQAFVVEMIAGKEDLTSAWRRLSSKTTGFSGSGQATVALSPTPSQGKEAPACNTVAKGHRAQKAQAHIPDGVVWPIRNSSPTLSPRAQVPF